MVTGGKIRLTILLFVDRSLQNIVQKQAKFFESFVVAKMPAVETHKLQRDIGQSMKLESCKKIIEIYFFLVV